MRILRIFGALALGCILLSGVGRAASAQQLVPTTGTPISLEVNKGILIRLDRNADTVFVADPAIADVKVKSARLIYLFAKLPGETSLYAVDAEEHVMMNRSVVVRRDLGRLQYALNQLIPSGQVDARSVDSEIVLAGNVATPLDAEEARRIARPFVGDEKDLVNRIQVTAPSQVNLRVRVAEVDHSIIKNLGINWDAIGRSGHFTFGTAINNPVTTAGTFITRNVLNGGATDTLFGGATAKDYSVNSTIDALAQNGFISILAEPNLTAMSGETASFLAGGEFPIVVPQGNQVVTIEFKPFGVALAFTPVVLNNGRISLRVRPEVSQLSTQGQVQINGFTIPALSTRRAETTVELGSGQSFAIGGLLQNNITDTLRKLPGLGDVPVLGPLFRSDQFARNDSELVIFVTPYLVRPVSDSKLAAPTDGMVTPNDFERLYHTRDTHPTLPVGGTAPVGPDGEKLIGPVGFILN
jgi:pilus assembly protein CpaC